MNDNEQRLRMENRYVAAVLVFLLLLAVIAQPKEFVGRAIGLFEDDVSQPMHDTSFEEPYTTEKSAPQSQSMRAPVPQRVPIAFSPGSIMLSRVSSPNAFGGNSIRYFIPFVTGGILYVYDLGQNGFLDGDDTGIHVVQGRNSLGRPFSYAPTPAFGDTILFLFYDPQGQSFTILAKDTGPDGFFGTGNEGTYVVAVPYGGFAIQSDSLYDLVPNGALYRVEDASTTSFLVRHNPVDRIFHALGLPTPTNDIIEVIRQGVNPITLPVRPATSTSRLVTWVTLQQGFVTNLLGPGPDNQFGGTDDEHYTLSGSSNIEEVGLINYDGSAVLTSLKYAGISQAAIYDLRPVGINGPQGIDGPRGRIPANPQPQSVPLPVPQGTVAGPFLVDLDINGGFINRNNQRIDGEGVFVFKVNINVPEGRSTQEMTIILYFNPGPNNRWLDSDDKVVIYQDRISGLDVLDIYVKEEFVTFTGKVGGVAGLYHWAV